MASSTIGSPPDQAHDVLRPHFFVDLDQERVNFLAPALFAVRCKQIKISNLVSGERHEADLIIRLRQQASFFLIHLEHQAQARPSFARRMFAYFARLHERYGLPVYPIALFSYDKPVRPEPQEYRVIFPDLEALIFRFRTVQLNQLDWHDFARRVNPVAAAFLARMRGAQAEEPQVLRHVLKLLDELHLPAAQEISWGAL